MDVLTNKVNVTTVKKKSPYSLKVVKNTIRHGLFLQGIRHALSKIGIDIMPYYWVQEEVIPTNEPKLRTDQVFTFKRLTLLNLKDVISNSDSINEKKIIESFEDGHECVGLLFNNEIAAYMFIELQDFKIKKRVFSLKSDEAYLLNMFTLPKFRGKNLAPYLRYKCYRHLEDRGITAYFSVSNYYNKSAIKFKKKLNSAPQKLYLNITLFNVVERNFTLKTYQ